MRDRLIAGAARALIAVLGHAPWSVSAAAGAVLGTAMWGLASRSARVTAANLERCFPELSPDERSRLARDSLRATGRLLAETAALWSGRRDWRERVNAVSGDPLVRDARARGRGVLVLAPHLGNWEVLNFYLGAEFSAAVLYRPSRIPHLDNLVSGRRSITGSLPVPVTASGLRVAVRQLRNGGVVGLLPDQVPERASGVHAPFFGVPALTMTLPHRLLELTSALPVLAVAWRRADGRFDIEFEPLGVAEPACPDAGAANCDRDRSCASAEALNAAVERLVRRDPRQYQWEYKRFKRGPEGAPGSYAAARERPVRRR